MFFTKLKYISYGICISLITTTLVTKAAGLNGVFGDYFTNMTLACPINSVITGFDASGTDYGMRHCSTLQTILGSIFGASTAPTGQAMLGFDASGNPKYGSVNWNNNGSDISYTGSNVGIGTAAPSSSLHVYRNTDDTATSIKVENNANGTMNDPGIILKSRSSAYAIFANDETNDLFFWDLFTNTPRMTIDGNGNVGIGANLNVAGKIKMQNQTVVTDSADTVVTKGYFENNPVDAPVGAVMPFMLATCPSGWVAANGANGTLDMRGEFIRGLDSGRGVDAGRALGSWQADMFKTHSTNMTAATNASGNSCSMAGVQYQCYSGYDNTWQISSVGGGAETRPRNVALLYCQKMVSTASTPSNNVTWTNTTGTNAGNVVQATVGNIGIGTNSPTAKLDVNGSTRIRSTNGEGGTIQLDGDNGINTFIENNNGTFRLINSPWNKELFVVDQNSNVGIGGGPWNGIGWPGSLNVNGSVRGARYYDDDTNYYVDSNTTSRMAAIDANQLCFNGDCRSNWASVGGGGGTSTAATSRNIQGNDSGYNFTPGVSVSCNSNEVMTSCTAFANSCGNGFLYPTSISGKTCTTPSVYCGMSSASTSISLVATCTSW